MKIIRWGIIGCGDVTEVKSGPAFQKAENSKLVAVMRRDARLAEDYAKRHNVPKWYDNADSLLDDDEIDAVYIATPPAFHMEYAIKAAEKGKIVYVEKPMAMNFEQCNLMIEACEKANVKLFVAYYRRALSRFIKVKKLVESGAIGETRFVSVNLYKAPDKEDLEVVNQPWRVNPDIAGGGKFVDLASHTFDILEFILGPIKSIKGIASNQAKLYNAEDMVSANFIFENGTQGVGSWCFSAYSNGDLNEILGSKGKISFSTFGNEPVKLTTQDKTEEFSFENPVHIQQPFIQSIVDELNGIVECKSKGESGARANWIIDEVLKEYKAK